MDSTPYSESIDTKIIENPDVVSKNIGDQTNRMESSTESIMEDDGKNGQSESTAMIVGDGETEITTNSTTASSTASGFTSEDFKVCIHNIPRYVESKALKKLMQRLGCENVRKAYVVGDHAFVCFGDEANVTKAIDALQNYQWKNKVLRAKRAAPNLDPLVWRDNKRARKDEQRGGRDSEETTRGKSIGGQQSTPSAESNRSPEEELLDAVVPLHKLPYGEQLASKDQESRKLLNGVLREISYSSDGKPPPPQLSAILASPIVDEYRNKCEFSIGYDRHNRPIVGFRQSRYKDGNVEIISPRNCPHISTATKKLVAFFDRFINEQGTATSLTPYDVKTKRGFWSMLTVREYLMDTLIIVTAYDRSAEASAATSTGNNGIDSIDRAKRDLIDLVEGSSKDSSENGFRITSLYFHLLKNSSDKCDYEHLWGSKYVYENLSGLRFRISPGAFFQVNTVACELLYKCIGDSCTIDEQTLVFDLCCGTGTIGIHLAKRAGKVIGIELSAEAVEDARINASNNELTNCEFIAGRVESVVDELRRRTSGGPWKDFKSVVGVLDPPRGGLPGKVLSSLRIFRDMSKVIYVSCDPKAASKNFVDLTRKTSNRYPGQAFKLTKVQPVDMFPHTRHFEWVLVFER